MTDKIDVSAHQFGMAYRISKNGKIFYPESLIDLEPGSEKGYVQFCFQAGGIFSCYHREIIRVPENDLVPIKDSAQQRLLQDDTARADVLSDFDCLIENCQVMLFQLSGNTFIKEKLDRMRAILSAPVVPDGWVAVQKKINAISDEYDRQDDRGYVDTPGGIENKFDAFRLIKEWKSMIAAAPKTKGGV